MAGLANPQDITLLFLLDISLPICQVVRRAPSPGCQDLGVWVAPGDCAVGS